jgi:anti-sigma factor RsiW
MSTRTHETCSYPVRLHQEQIRRAIRDPGHETEAPVQRRFANRETGSTRAGLLALIAAALIAAFPAAALAGTWSSSATTIQAAVNVANPGDTSSCPRASTRSAWWWTGTT